MALLGGVALVEVLTLSLGWDAQALFGPSVGFGIGAALTFALFFVTGTLVIGGSPLLAALAPPRLHRRRLLAQLALFGLFVLLTDRAARGDGPGPAWWLVGVLAALTWLWAWGPAHARLAAREGLGARLALGVGVGLAAGVLGSLNALAWPLLADATLHLAAALAGAGLDDVVLSVDERILGSGGFTVVVAPECSGIEGVGLMLALMGGYAWVRRSALGMPRAVAVVIGATLLVWLANSLRIALLVALGTVAPDVAIGGFHSRAGAVFFLAVALGVVAAVERGLSAEAGAQRAAPDPAVPYLLPFLAVLGVGFVSGSFAASADPLYGLRIAVGALLVWRTGAWARLAPRGPSLAALGVGVVAFGAWAALVGEPAPDAGGGPPAGSGWPWIATRVLGAVALVPLVEELAFRGFLMRRLAGADFEGVAYSSVGHRPVWISSLARWEEHTSELQ